LNPKRPIGFFYSAVSSDNGLLDLTHVNGLLDFKHVVKFVYFSYVVYFVFVTSR